jgi:hypothetical protein
LLHLYPNKLKVFPCTLLLVWDSDNSWRYCYHHLKKWSACILTKALFTRPLPSLVNGFRINLS